VPVKSYITDPATDKIAGVSDNLDGSNRLHVDALFDTAKQQPIPVTFGLVTGALPKMLTLDYNASMGAVVASVYRRVYTYSVPAGYNGYLIRYTSYQNEAAQSRVVSEVNLGTLSIVTNTFVTSNNSYVYPQWSGLIQAEVTTGLTAGAGNVVVTVTYTNEASISARTGTITIPKGSLAESRWDLVLQVGDVGLQSIQAMSVAPTLAAGAIKLLGFIQLGYHEDGGTTALETLYAPGATTFPAGTTLGLEFQGGAVSKTRRFDVLVQLLKEVV